MELVTKYIKNELKSVKYSYSYKELEKITGYNQTTIWRKFNNKSKMDLDFVYKLEEAGIIKPLAQMFKGDQ